jgi:hypothetical protein
MSPQPTLVNSVRDVLLDRWGSVGPATLPCYANRLKKNKSMKAKSRVSSQLSPFKLETYRRSHGEDKVNTFARSDYALCNGTIGDSAAPSRDSMSGRNEIWVAPTAQQLDSRTGAKE